MLYNWTFYCQCRIRFILHSALVGQRRSVTNFFHRISGAEIQSLSLRQQRVVKRKNSYVSTVCSALRKDDCSSGLHNCKQVISTERTGSLEVNEKDIKCESQLSTATLSLPIFIPTDSESAESFIKLPLKCRGCGAFMQTQNPTVKGYILPKKLPSLLRKNSLEDLICSNCFSLRYANRPLTLGIDKDNVFWQLKPLRKSKAIILYVVDILDISGSLMPEITQLIGEEKAVIIVGNKLDMLASDGAGKPRQQENYVAEVLRRCCIDEGLDEKVIKDVCLVSGVSGYGFEKLVVLINKHRDIDMNLYVMGSTNVGKSTIFNMLQNLAAISKDADMPTQAISHRIPGSTNGLVRHPLAYWRMKKVRKMLLEKPKEDEREQTFEFVEDIIKDIRPSKRLQNKDNSGEVNSDETALEKLLDHDLSEDVDLFSLEKQKRWIYDTPSLLNTQQITQFLTPSELKFIQHQLWVVPKTFLMKPGRSLLLGGLARIDYCEITRKSLADPSQYEEVPKIPFGDENRRGQYPELEPKEYNLTGDGWEESCADLTIAGIGWIAVTAGKGSMIKLNLHTPNGIGQAQRDQCLMPHSVRQRGKRGIRYAGHHSKYIYQCTRKKNPQLVASFEKQNEIMKAWLIKVKEKLVYQRFEMKQDRKRLLLEQGVKGQIRKYEEKLALIEKEAANIMALESGAK